MGKCKGKRVLCPFSKSLCSATRQWWVWQYYYQPLNTMICNHREMEQYIRDKYERKQMMDYNKSQSKFKAKTAAVAAGTGTPPTQSPALPTRNAVNNLGGSQPNISAPGLPVRNVQTSEQPTRTVSNTSIAQASSNLGKSDFFDSIDGNTAVGQGALNSQRPNNDFFQSMDMNGNSVPQSNNNTAAFKSAPQQAQTQQQSAVFGDLAGVFTSEKPKNSKDAILSLFNTTATNIPRPQQMQPQFQSNSPAYQYQSQFPPQQPQQNYQYYQNASGQQQFYPNQQGFVQQPFQQPFQQNSNSPFAASNPFPMNNGQNQQFPSGFSQQNMNPFGNSPVIQQQPIFQQNASFGGNNPFAASQQYNNGQQQQRPNNPFLWNPCEKIMNKHCIATEAREQKALSQKGNWENEPLATGKTKTKAASKQSFLFSKKLTVLHNLNTKHPFCTTFITFL